jgi:molybdopterin-dependent oxidoreductase alpha subunit
MAVDDERALVPAPATAATTTTTLKAPYRPAAAGPSAVVSSLRYALKTSGLSRGLHVFLNVNQARGFDCPGCAWPDPLHKDGGHRAIFEFCENGARAIAHEADTRRADAAFFARFSVEELRKQSDFWLEQQGRLTEPMVKRPGATHYQPISWDDAFALIGRTLKGLARPDDAVFYTSGRTANEAAFLYQLFVRAYGTNNLPDCSNMCHESSGMGLNPTIGIGKGTVQLADFEKADCILVIGQNPGTNHPRMLSTLQAAAARGCAIVAVNPIKERALQSFAHPQHGLGVIGIGSKIATHWAQVKINGDVALLKGIMKVVVDEDRRHGNVLDRRFLAEHTVGLEAFLKALDAVSWDVVVEQSGIARADIEVIGRLYARSERVIACWAMGITQHENGVDNVKEIVNLLLLRGNIGREGAGACPVRGHSNVQGDRTMGIYEAPSETFLQALDDAAGITSPRAHGLDVVHAIEALEAGTASVFVGMGGNLVAAAPDTPRVDAALSKAKLTVQIATKLNRTHLAAGEHALVLPCLGRSEVDRQGPHGGQPQFVTVENSMGVVHKSEGRLAPPSSSSLRSEVAIVCGIADATLGDLPKVKWRELSDSYDRIRDVVAAVVPGFTGFNDKLKADPEGFVLRNAAREREWRTASGKAELSVVDVPHWHLKPDELLLMTLRSHDQFNTTIYEESDRYRGVYHRRDVLFVSPADLHTRGLNDGDRVDITSHFQGKTRTVKSFAVVAYDIPAGSVAGYFPELNPLVPLESRARGSHTPTSKSVVVTLARAGSRGVT